MTAAPPTSPERPPQSRPNGSPVFFSGNASAVCSPPTICPQYLFEKMRRPHSPNRRRWAALFSQAGRVFTLLKVHKWWLVSLRAAAFLFL